MAKKKDTDNVTRQKRPDMRKVFNTVPLLILSKYIMLNTLQEPKLNA